MSDFLLAVLSLPGVLSDEADYMEALLSAGLERLHLRKPAATEEELEALVRRLAPRWGENLVLHGPRSRELALRYGVPNVHGAVEAGLAPKDNGALAVRRERPRGPMVDAAGLRLSTSVHGWEEFGMLPEGLAYAFISPVFDSISKRGYSANAGLLKRPAAALPCLAVGLGGVSDETIGSMLAQGWGGVAVLGWIWEEPKRAVERLAALQKIIADGT